MESLALTSVLAAQRSLITRTQALELGLSSSAISRRVGTHEWQRLLPEVYLVGATEPTWIQLVHAALMWGGDTSCLSHRSAARLLKLDVSIDEHVHIFRDRRNSPARWLIVHRPGSTLASDRLFLDGTRCTSATRTIIDLTLKSTPKELEMAVHSALHRRLTSVPKLVDRIDRCSPRMGSRLKPLIDLLDGSPPAQSRFEINFMRAIRGGDWAPPVRQFEVQIGERHFFLDFAWPEQRVAVECDSFAWHASPSAWAATCERRNALTAGGWVVLQCAWSSLRDPRTLLAQLGAALDR